MRSRTKKTGLLFYVLSAIVVYVDAVVVIGRLLYSADLRAGALLSVGIELIGIIVMAVFIDGSYVDGGLSEETNYSSVRGILVVSIAFLIDTCRHVSSGFVNPIPRALYFLFTSLSYLSDVALIYCFAQYILAVLKIKTKKTRLFVQILRYYFALLTALLILNVPFRFIFSVDRSGVFQGGFLLPFVVGVDVLLMGAMFIYVLKLQFDLVEKRAILLYISLPPVFAIAQEIQPAFSFKLCALFVSACLVYVQSYVRQGRLLQKERLELQNQQTAIMLSQIQPHFLYNSLNAIVALCDIDPQLAKQTTIDFSTYLEHNLNALTQKELILFSQEMEHVKAYLRIEKTRFGDMLNVEYDVQEQDFFVPALTVQPLVENAVKHGLHHQPGGGTVRIETHKTDDGWYILVTDDGVGFDPEHSEIIGHGVGIANIRHRLQTQCGGMLNLESEKGRGTTAIVFIPNGRKEK